MFIRALLIRPERSELPHYVPDFTILCLPSFKADPKRHGVRTETVVAINFAKRMILIGGSYYAGEMKKSVFTTLNYYLPAESVMPMHCSANVGPAGDVALFFGLSGTGKTTLSADPNRTLIGDDEHGWSGQGVFNFEGGCYAKCIKLSAEAEPEIYAATNRFGAILENVVYDPDIDCPLYFAVTPANVNDITPAKAMPIDPQATYVFDLGYYDFAWWAALDAAGCRIVTRLKSNTPLAIVVENDVPKGQGVILSDRIGHLPQRLSYSRKNPFQDPVREILIRIETGKVLRLITNDLDADAQAIADLYKKRWQVELFFRWVKQVLKIKHFLGTSENAVRIQIAAALIAFVLLRIAQATQCIVTSSLTFARLIRANLMHRRTIGRMLDPDRPREKHPQMNFGFLPC